MSPGRITNFSECFSYDDACRVSNAALRGASDPPGAPGGRRPTVVIDLTKAADATTAAFARLVQLRRALLRLGRDLRLTGLHGRAKGVYEVNRLGRVLPRE